MNCCGIFCGSQKGSEGKGKIHGIIPAQGAVSVTDISYIHTDEGVIYLSMIRDLYDNSIVAYKTAVQQTVSLEPIPK